MKKQVLFDATNNLAKELGLTHWIIVDNEVFAPMAMSTLASVAWVKDFPENENTRIIRKQLERLWYEGALKLED